MRRLLLVWVVLMMSCFGLDAQAQAPAKEEAARPKATGPEPAVKTPPKEKPTTSTPAPKPKTPEASKGKTDVKPSQPRADRPKPVMLVGRAKPRYYRRRWPRRRKHDPFTFRSGPYSLKVKAQLQVQAVAFAGKDALYENGDPATDEGVLIRRARVGVAGTLPWNFEYLLVIEAFGDLQRGSSGMGLAGQSIGAQLLDASITWAKYGFLKVSVGADKAPGAKGRMVSSTNLQLIERPFGVELLAIDRRAGAWLKGDFKYFNYHVGVFNGDEGVSFGNEGGGYLVAGRVETTPLGPMGIGRSDGLSRGSSYFNKIRVSAGVSFQYQHGPSTDQMFISADLGFKWHGLSVAAEVFYLRGQPLEDPTRSPLLPELNESLGAYAQAGYFILPGKLEVAARFEYLDANFKIDDVRDIWAITGGVNYYWTRHIRSQLAYTHKEEMNHPQVENDSFVLQMQVAF